MSVSSGQLSIDLAHWMGERSNRSVSRRFSDSLFGPARGPASVGAVHGIISVAATSIAATPAQYRGWVAAAWGVGALIAWLNGEPKQSPPVWGYRNY